MTDEAKASIISAVLMIGVAVLFATVLHKTQNVVPLFLVPLFLFAGYAVSKGGFKLWVILTTIVTTLLAIVYALP